MTFFAGKVDVGTSRARSVVAITKTTLAAADITVSNISAPGGSAITTGTAGAIDLANTVFHTDFQFFQLYARISVSVGLPARTGGGSGFVDIYQLNLAIYPTFPYLLTYGTSIGPTPLDISASSTGTRSIKFFISSTGMIQAFDSWGCKEGQTLSTISTTINFAITS